ncbi:MULTISPECIES: MetQ/NlpA family ABC transporter substrate-binding protein [unclassified Gemella]|uniref:MetQ/NlpA family ABC transporter substrate-binding protein n=1 Tax=unclassified Gemella TaxID=2624949 RepID=UPI0010733828|nr:MULTISPECIES: MetQ/NlpA family ABC transporter substrate-binding protein [unclassified Gemella]MBF0709894.1 methionine ABC transporter substrate-binding protein [Gemella sp. GL1.1]MBF0746802.1 methionine ABC transporter substrate-binding protein [Gemella sp. 19428wG2_WT2a]NYS27238.1 methionine ABC transporter substrate-binding protein [Gemella sp. GL1]TFU59527.1 methionine ABC transporter substrate-binding protein [Gemella sp. WT2a]
MKKFLKAFAATTLLSVSLVGSTALADEKKGIDVDTLDPSKPVTVKIGASNVPHAELLEEVAPKLEKEGIKLDIVPYQDYYLPNKNLNEKEIDLNYFQHVPFLNKEVEEKGYKLDNAGAIHIEPIGLYSKKVKSLSELEEGAKVLVSNNKSEWGRVLKLLQDNGLVKIKDGVDVVTATFDDVVENPKKLEFKYDNDPAIMVQYYNNNEGDLISINTNFAVDAGITPKDDAIALESGENNPYGNIIVTRAGDKDKVVTKKIVEALKSEETVKFIEEKYKGAVLPVK